MSLPAGMRGREWIIAGERRIAPPMVRRIFRVLWSRRGKFVSRKSLMTLLYGARKDPPNDKVLSVYIFVLRRLLRGSEFEIVRSYGEGWQLVPNEGRYRPKRMADRLQARGLAMLAATATMRQRGVNRTQ